MKKAILFKIKDDKKDLWYAWCHEIATTLLSEAEASLKEEKVLYELALGFSLNKTDFVIGYMEGECLPANMDRDINQKHRKMKQECLERVGEIDVLYGVKA